MPVFIGGTTFVPGESLLAIIAWKYFTQGENKEYLDRCQKENRVIDITEGGSPKSLVITDKDLYISSISPLTLKKRTDRLKKGIYECNIVEEN